MLVNSFNAGFKVNVNKNSNTSFKSAIWDAMNEEAEKKETERQRDKVRDTYNNEIPGGISWNAGQKAQRERLERELDKK